MDIAHGPINVAAGLAFGSVAGVLLGCTRLWNTRALRTIATVVGSQILMFAGVHFGYTGAGALGSLVMAIFASKLWANTKTPAWYRTQTSTEHAHMAEADVALFWRYIAQPVLFGIIGTAVDFHVLNPASIPKALAIIAVGVLVRLPVASAVTFGAGLNAKERCALALANIVSTCMPSCALHSQPKSVVSRTCTSEPARAHLQALHWRLLAGESDSASCTRVCAA